MYERINELFEKKDSEKLLEEMKPLILSSIKKYYNDYSNYDDLIQDGNLEILKLLNEDRLESGRHLLGYAKNALRFLYLDKHKSMKNIISLNQSIGDSEGLEIKDTIEDKNLRQEDLMIENEKIRELELALGMLTENQRNIIKMFYMERESIQKIACRLNVSYRTVVNTKTAAIKKLKSIYDSKK